MMVNENIKVFICGPSYHPEERRSMRRIAHYLEKNGFSTYLPSRDGIEHLLLYLAHNHEINDIKFNNIYDVACKISFALEIYQIVETCDCTVLNINGRVPDEGSVFKAAVAFGAGKPVVNYKYDSRILFPNGDNAMITGLTPDFKPVNRFTEVAKKILKLTRKFNKQGENPYKGDNIPPLVRKWIELGQEVAKFLKTTNVQNDQEMDGLDLIEKIVEEYKNNPIVKSLVPNLNLKNATDNIQRKTKKKVYCSGALFCPVEVAEMAGIAKSLEDAGYDTYLPHRDGGEAFVMNSIDTPIAGSPLLRPFTNYLTKVMFALDIYEILKCDYFIINLNGRVPDDGAVSELGVAFASGRPIIQFKSDLRSLSNGRDHPMIAGAALHIPPVHQLEQIPVRLGVIVKYLSEFGVNTYEGDKIPHSVKKIVNLGFKVWKFTHDKKKPQNQMTAWL